MCFLILTHTSYSSFPASVVVCIYSSIWNGIVLAIFIIRISLETSITVSNNSNKSLERVSFFPHNFSLFVNYKNYLPSNASI